VAAPRRAEQVQRELAVRAELAAKARTTQPQAVLVEG